MTVARMRVNVCMRWAFTAVLMLVCCSFHGALGAAPITFSRSSTTAAASTRYMVSNERELATTLTEIADHQGDVNRMIEIATRGSFKGVTYSRMADMTDLIGHRLCGSEAAADAVKWVQAQLASEGFDSVTLEPTTETQWVRGNERATLTRPRARPLSLPMLGLGNSIGTPPELGQEGITADVVLVRSRDELNNRTDIKGKIVVWNPICDWVANPTGCYSPGSTIRSNGAVWAAAAGAVASFTRSVTGFSMRTPHTGGSIRTTIPSAALTTEDVDMLQRFQDRGLPITISLYMEAQMKPNVQGYNVVAEIRGTTKPNEVVLVSGHLDSWDVGTGAMDDLGGTFISWSVLSLMLRANLRAQRTVRLVMWSCEEQGGLGGNTYYNDHIKEVDQMNLVMESDLGVFKPQGLQFSASNQYAVQMVQAVGQLLSAVNCSTVTGGGGGTDIASYSRVGVPAASLLNDNARYFNYHHTQADMLNVLDSAQLDLASAVWASYAYVIADLDSMLPRGQLDLSRNSSSVESS